MPEPSIDHSALNDLGDGARPADPKEAGDQTRVQQEQPQIKPTPAIGAPEMVTIILEEGEHIPPGGQPIGHNGTFYLLKPGIEQTMPEHLLNVLDDAIMEKPIMTSDGMRRVGWRKMLRFPYRRVA